MEFRQEKDKITIDGIEVPTDFESQLLDRPNQCIRCSYKGDIYEVYSKSSKDLGRIKLCKLCRKALHMLIKAKISMLQYITGWKPKE